MYSYLFFGGFMGKKRFVFDLDNTLLTFDREYQLDFFREEFGENNPFIEDSYEYSATYWANFSRYKDDRFVHFLSQCSGIPIEEDFVEKWKEVIREMPIVLEEGVVDTLEYLKNKYRSLAVLTNWYGDCQIDRLKRAGILSYFSGIYSGDFVLKPRREAYLEAAGHYFRDEVVFIGDNVENDYIGPRNIGFEAVLYDKNDKHPKNLIKIKRMNELIERY
jgi:HAD superfamily hydrolase (TIGR01549 family)